MLDVLYQNRHDDDALLQSGCAEGGDSMKELTGHFPAVYVTNAAFRGINWERVRRGLRRCIVRSGKIERLNKERKRAKHPRRPLRHPRTHFIFEDCAFDKSIRGSQPLTYLFQVGRRYVRAIHVSLQRVTGLHPDQRRQCSYIFMMYTAVPTIRREMYEEYIGRNAQMSFQQFSCLMDGLQRYQALVFMPQKKADNIWGQFAYYKAPLRTTEWKFGRKAYWRAHKRWFDPNYFERELDEMLGPHSTKPKRKAATQLASTEDKVTVKLADKTTTLSTTQHGHRQRSHRGSHGTDRGRKRRPRRRS